MICICNFRTWMLSVLPSINKVKVTSLSRENIHPLFIFKIQRGPFLCPSCQFYHSQSTDWKPKDFLVQNLLFSSFSWFFDSALTRLSLKHHNPTVIGHSWAKKQRHFPYLWKQWTQASWEDLIHSIFSGHGPTANVPIFHYSPKSCRLPSVSVMVESLCSGLLLPWKHGPSDHQQLAAEEDTVSELLSLRFYWRSFSPHLQASMAQLAGVLK